MHNNYRLRLKFFSLNTGAALHGCGPHFGKTHASEDKKCTIIWIGF